MKKKISVLLCGIIVLGLCTPTLTSCSYKDREKDEETVISTINNSQHLSPNESDTANQTLAPTAAPTEKPTEKPTEPPTEEPTEPPTEKPTEKPTEAPTEEPTEPAPSLKYVSFDNGTCSVSGIGDVKDVYLVIPEKSPTGEVVVAIEDKAFYENSTIKAVQIPSTVMSIGELAFGGCTSLVYVSVDEKNRAYIDLNGILYTKDKTKLILLPGANPAGEIFISASVKEIAPMAFYNTSSLKTIKYGGTLSDWNKIKIGDKNYGIYAASLSFAVTE
jgi:hypothetical protein